MDAHERNQWRMMAAMLAMNGLLSSGSRSADIAELSFKVADDMMEQAEQNVGIVSIKKRGKK